MLAFKCKIAAVLLSVINAPTAGTGDKPTAPACPVLSISFRIEVRKCAIIVNLQSGRGQGKQKKNHMTTSVT